MAKAKVTLVHGLSLAIGKYRFVKNKTVLVTDSKVIEALKVDGAFSVVEVKEEGAKAAQAAPAPKKKAVRKPAASAKPQAEASDDKKAGE